RIRVTATEALRDVFRIRVGAASRWCVAARRCPYHPCCTFMFIADALETSKIAYHARRSSAQLPVNAMDLVKVKNAVNSNRSVQPALFGGLVLAGIATTMLGPLMPTLESR